MNSTILTLYLFSAWTEIQWLCFFGVGIGTLVVIGLFMGAMMQVSQNISDAAAKRRRKEYEEEQ